MTGFPCILVVGDDLFGRMDLTLRMDDVGILCEL